MTAAGGRVGKTGVDTERDSTLVWIDASRAVIARWHAGAVKLEHVPSDVPAHHRSTGHVRYDPAVRHGGGAPQDAGEARRLEHLGRFVQDVGARIGSSDDVLILGHGTVRDRLAHDLRESDRHASRLRSIECHAAGSATDRQLVARLRVFAGDEPVRRTTGPYRPGSALPTMPKASARSGRADRYADEESLDDSDG